jgi:hypothetical protein
MDYEEHYDNIKQSAIIRHFAKLNVGRLKFLGNAETPFYFCVYEDTTDINETTNTDIKAFETFEKATEYYRQQYTKLYHNIKQNNHYIKLYKIGKNTLTNMGYINNIIP